MFYLIRYSSEDGLEYVNFFEHHADAYDAILKELAEVSSFDYELDKNEVLYNLAYRISPEYPHKGWYFYDLKVVCYETGHYEWLIIPGE